MPEVPRPLASLLDELRQVLELERQTLVTGNPETINAITLRKLALAEAIDAAWHSEAEGRPSRELLVWLDRFNRENAIICAAMLRHLTLALDKLRSDTPHRSYGPDGAEQNGTVPQALGAA
jgi:hypothetical protein